jgi:hypothetical protein
MTRDKLKQTILKQKKPPKRELFYNITAKIQALSFNTSTFANPIHPQSD